MFKLPSGAELRGLFFAPTKVAHAIGGIETAAKNAQMVCVHNRRKGSARLVDSAMYQALADKADDAADGHFAEAERATRVSVKLAELIA